MTTLTIDIPDFLSRTMDYTAEEIGALVLLMAHYRLNGPFADSAHTIARVCRMEAADQDDFFDAKDRLQRFFTVDGDWHNDSLDAQRERDGRLRSRAKKASDAAHGKTAAEPNNGLPTIRSEFVSAAPKPTTLAEADLNTTDDGPEFAEVQSADEIDNNIDIGGTIPESMTLSGPDVIRCRTEAPDATNEEIAAIFDSFHRYHSAAGTIVDDWTAAWWRWWDRKKPAATPKAKPRIEVSRKKAVDAEAE